MTLDVEGEGERLIYSVVQNSSLGNWLESSHFFLR